MNWSGQVRETTAVDISGATTLPRCDKISINIETSEATPLYHRLVLGLAGI